MALGTWRQTYFGLRLAVGLLCTFEIHPFALGAYLGTSLIVGNLVYNGHGLVEATLGSKYREDLDLNIDLQSVDVNDVAPSPVKLSDAKHHISFLFSFLLCNSSYFGVNKIINSQSY